MNIDMNNVGLAIWCAFYSVLNGVDYDDCPVQGNNYELIRNIVLYDNSDFLELLGVSEKDFADFEEYTDELDLQDTIQFYDEYSEILRETDKQTRARELCSQLCEKYAQYSDDFHKIIRFANIFDFTPNDTGCDNPNSKADSIREQFKLAAVFNMLSEEEMASIHAEWMDKYGPFLSRNVPIDFDGKIFVFSGLDADYRIRDNPLIKQLEEQGGIFRQSISGKTDYLIIDPSKAGRTKTDAAIEQIKKGKDIKIILLEDFENAIAADKETLSDRVSTAELKEANANEEDNPIPTKLPQNEKIRLDGQSSSYQKINNPKTKKISRKTVPIQHYNPEDFEIENGVLKAYVGKNPILVIPEGVTNIDEGFSLLNSERLTDIFFPDSLKSLPDHAFMGIDRFKNLRNIDLGHGIEKIGDCCFWGMNIEEIVIPGNVKSIGSFAFKDCKSLKKLTLEKGIETIGINAFSGTRIDEVFIPASVAEIGHDAFPIETLIKGSRGSEAEIYVHKTPGCKYQLECEDPNAFFTKKQEKDKEKKPKKNESEEFIIKEGCLLKYVGENPYVKLPKDVKIVKATAFSSSSVIQDVDLNSDELEEIEEATFSNCSNLEHLTFGGKLTIHKNTVSNCPLLQSIHIPRMVKTIEDGAFCNCPSLEWIYLPKTLKSASNEMIENCPAFKRYRIDGLNPYLKSINGVIIKRAKGELPKKHDDQLIGDDPIRVDDILSLTREKGLEYELCHYSFLKADHIRVSGQLKPGDLYTLFSIYLHFQQSHEWMFFENNNYGIEQPKMYAVCDLPKDVFAELSISTISDFWQTNISVHIVSAKDRSYDFECSEHADSSAEARKKAQTVLIPVLNRFMQSVFVNGSKLNIPQLQYEDFKYSREELLNLIKDKPYSPDSLFVFPSEDNTVLGVQQSAKKTVQTAREATARAKAKAEAEETARREAKAKARAEAEAKAEAEAQERTRAEAEAKARAEAEAKARAEAEAKARAEAEARAKAAEEEKIQKELLAAAQAKYEELAEEIKQQRKIIDQNRGWFGAPAKARKAAQEELRRLESQIKSEFPDGKP